MTKDKITDEYIKAVQKQFKHYHAADTRFISDLKNAVISYAAQQDSLDYEQLVSQFGDPQELVNDYFRSNQLISKKKPTLFTKCQNNLYHCNFDCLGVYWHFLLYSQSFSPRREKCFYSPRNHYFKGG